MTKDSDAPASTPVVLGVHLDFDPSAALVCDGRVLAYSEEERHTRYKHSPKIDPCGAIQSCLALANLSPHDITHIAINWDLDAFNDGRVQRFYTSLSQRYPVDAATLAWQKRNLVNRRHDAVEAYFSSLWRRMFGIRKIPAIQSVPHHFVHAFQAYHQSPYDEAVCITIDGSGDTECTVVWRCGKGKITAIRTFEMPNSLGWFYAAFTEYLGFEAYDGEYKVMGLAAYGRHRDDLYQSVSKILSLSDDGVGYSVEPAYIHYGVHSYSGRFTDLLVECFGRPPRKAKEKIDSWHEDLAHAVQSALETVVCRIVRWAIEYTGIRNICLGGGVALNVKMNSKIFAMREVEAVFAHPLCADSGAAAGSALAVCKELTGKGPEKLNSLALGHAENDESIEKALRAAKVPYRRVDDIVPPVAHALSRGLIVGWFQGRMEGGPRALGNRSILADPRDESNRDKVNAIVKFREYWRPFCPSIASEYMSECFERYVDAPFMIIAFEAKERLRKMAPAIVHVDNSVRVQAVSADRDPLYHRLLKAFGEVSGAPVLLNTSFNVKGEPIVCTATDALRTFWSTGLDVLAIGNFLVEKRVLREITSA